MYNIAPNIMVTYSLYLFVMMVNKTRMKIQICFWLAFGYSIWFAIRI